jgi:phenylalanyl-tRNA synthetase beta chain
MSFIMKVSLSSLRELITLDLAPEEIANVLTNIGLEVDAVEPVTLASENVVVAKVLGTERHPDAEKLCIATISDGADTLKLVCGAPNCKEGLVTAYAPIGARVKGDGEKIIKIKKSKIRGVESCGMLCSEKELGISEEQAGIISLPTECELGSNVGDIFSDVVFEISITPNLAHCASIIGVVRELAAATGAKWKMPESPIREDTQTKTEQLTAVHVHNKEKCPRYACRILKGITVSPSPQWLQRRLELMGIRSVNNIVDVTNYVLWELGQPLHAFDFDLIAGHKIEVRTAEEGEKFVTLDDQERELKTDDLLICDGDKAIALAGVMGGKNSEVNENTTQILLESAHFEPRTVRRTSKRLGINSDSSYHFERGVDPDLVPVALDRAASLIQELTGATVTQGCIDVKAQEFEEKYVKLRLSRVNRVLGTKLVFGEVSDIFEKLKFSFTWNGNDEFTVKIPNYRFDVSIEEDLIEEVARMYGYNHIKTDAARYTTSTIPHAPSFLFEREIRGRLIAEGLQEFLTSDLISPTLAALVPREIIPKQDMIQVLNPTSTEQSVLRQSLLPGLLQLVRYNCDHQNRDVCGFEIGRVHFKNNENFEEQILASIVLSGNTSPYHWECKDKEVDFFDLKGIVENVFDALGIDDLALVSSSTENFHPGRQAILTAGRLNVGIIGEIHPRILRKLDVKQRIFFAELNLQDLFSLKKKEWSMQSLPQFPGSERDWTLTVKEETLAGHLLDAVNAIPSKLLDRVSLRDIYRSDTIGADVKNVSMRFIYRDNKKTLAQNAVDKEHQRLINGVMEKLGGRIIK